MTIVYLKDKKVKMRTRNVAECTHCQTQLFVILHSVHYRIDTEDIAHTHMLGRNTLFFSLY